MITIGCDPEFVILDENNRLVEASQLPLSLDDLLGEDGGGRVFEIRPEYSSNTLDVVEHIKRIFLKAKESLPVLWEYTWLAGHYPRLTKRSHIRSAPCGGHIHIGGLNMPYAGGEQDKLVSALDYTLSHGLSDLIDDISQRTLRRRTGYGTLGNWREADTAGWDDTLIRIEYRTPGSFLISPPVSFLNLVLAKATALSYKTHKVAFKKLCSIRPLSAKTILTNLIPIMRELSSGRGNEDIDLGVQVLKEFLDYDIKINWNEDFRKNWEVL